MADSADPAALQQHIHMLAAFVHAWRESGVIALITFYDAALIRLMIAAGALEKPGSIRNSHWNWPIGPECISTTPNFCDCARGPLTIC